MTLSYHIRPVAFDDNVTPPRQPRICLNKNQYPAIIFRTLRYNERFSAYNSQMKRYVDLQAPSSILLCQNVEQDVIILMGPLFLKSARDFVCNAGVQHRREQTFFGCNF